MNYFDDPVLGVPYALRIVATPLGDAPSWVREAWVGVVIPLLDPVARPQDIPVISVLEATPHSPSLPHSNAPHLPDGFWRGYRVLAIDAFEALRASRPDAAEWWFTTLPYLLQADQHLVFDERCGIVQSLGEPT